MTLWLFAYSALGLAVGFFAGLLGIGGGVLMVPLLVIFFSLQGGFAPSEILHMALGTSMAGILFTAISSTYTHHRHQAVQWHVFRVMVPGILFGTFLGSQIASAMPTRPLALFFACFVSVVAVQMGFNLSPKPAQQLPGKWGFFGTSTGIGALSTLVAVGGGTMMIPFFVWCNLRVQHAIATSAAVGIPIAVGGTAGYIWNGWGQSSLPEGSLGYVYLPALLPLVIGSMSSAPFGARLAHRLPVSLLRRLFALLLLSLAIHMFYKLTF